MIFITLHVFHHKYFIIWMFVLFAMLNQGGWTVNSHRNLISFSYRSLWAKMYEYSGTYHSALIQCMALIFHLKWVKVSAHRLFNLFCREVVVKSGNSTVCSSNCHYSENTKLNIKVAWTLCSPIEGKHLCPVSDVCDPSYSRKMYLKVWFPALCDLVYKYWIAAKF